MRGDLLPRFLRPSRIPVLKVRTEIDVEPVVLELYELEVTAPRDDFELEVARTIQVAKSGETGAGGRAPGSCTANSGSTRRVCGHRRRRSCAGSRRASRCRG